MLDFNTGVGLKLFWKNNFLSPPGSVKILYQSWLFVVLHSEDGCVIYLFDITISHDKQEIQFTPGRMVFIPSNSVQK